MFYVKILQKTTIAYSIINDKKVEVKMYKKIISLLINGMLLLSFISCETNYSKSTNSNEKNVIKNSSFDEEYYKSTLATIKYL